MQLRSYRDDFAAFEQVGAVVLTVSPQDVDSHERWAEQEGFPFALLADTDKSVIEAYGISAPGVGVRRSVFLIDSDGIIRYRLTAGIRAIFKKPAALARTIAAMS
jgi:peroxiredoxin Q/BCP